MRVVYLTQANIVTNSGVKKKIFSSTDHWKKLGHEVLIVSFHSVEKYNLKDNQVLNGEAIECSILESRFASAIPITSLRNFLNKVFSLPEALETIQKWNPDLIYYRHGTWFPGIEKIFNIAPSVFEINTIDEYQMKYYSAPRRFITKKYNARLLSHASGFVFISKEIRDFYKSLRKPGMVIGNGFTLRKTRVTPGNPVPNIVFMGSENHEWHGADKVLEMAQRLPEFHFHFIGPDYQGHQSNVTYHGFLSDQEINDLLPDMDIGVGSLSLHIINIHEASPLKVRHYLSYGLPTIVGYDDTDLEGEDFILNIGNHEKNVEENISCIKDFVSRWHDKKVPFEALYPKIDFEVKEQQRFELFDKVLESEHTSDS